MVQCYATLAKDPEFVIIVDIGKKFLSFLKQD